jgi:hypothetical protein
MTADRLVEIMWMTLEVRSKFTYGGIIGFGLCHFSSDTLVKKGLISKEEEDHLLSFLQKWFSSPTGKPNGYWLTDHSTQESFMETYRCNPSGQAHRNNILLDAIAFVESTGTYK